MAITYGYFDSINGDRKYNADQMSEYFDGIVSDGVFQSVGGALAVSAQSTPDMSVKVASGRAIINNKWIKNDADITLPITAASTAYARITSVVVQLDPANRLIRITTKDGTPSGSPVAPEITENELEIARITVAANATSIAGSAITDKREYVHGVIKQVDWGGIGGNIANQSDLQNLLGLINARIDNIIGLTPGSTTGDAELADIRVGADGTTYSTAGEAVRSQVSKLNSNFIAEYNSGNSYSVDDYCTYKLNTYRCKTATTGAWNGMKWEKVETLPAIATNKILCSYLKNLINDIAIIDELSDISFSVINNYVLYYGSKDAIEGSTYNISSDIAVVPGEVYIIDCSAQFKNSFYAIYDSSGSPIQYKNAPGGGSISRYYDVIVIPYGAANMAISIADTGSVRKITKYNKIKRDRTPFEFLKIRSQGTSVSYNTIPGRAVIEDGTIIVSGDPQFCITDYIDVSNYVALKIITYAGYNNAVYAFYDAGKNFIVSQKAESGAYKLSDNEFVPVPKGAKYLIVNYVTTKPSPIIESIEKTGKWSGKKWVCFGDSLTEQNIRTTKHYYEYIADLTGINTVVMGVGGSGYKKREGTNEAFYQRIVDVPTDADVITIFGSFNDLSSGASLGNIDDTTTNTIAGCINTTIDELYNNFTLANLGIVSPTPWIGASAFENSTNAINYVNMLEAICNKRGIPFLNMFRCSGLRPWDEAFRLLAYSRDGGNGVHPDETGHKIMAPHFESFLDSLLLY